MSQSVAKWLAQIGLSQYAGQFSANDIDWALLRELDQETLIAIGIESAGHRLRILKAARSLSPDSTGADQPESAASTAQALSTAIHKPNAGNSL